MSDCECPECGGTWIQKIEFEGDDHFDYCMNCGTESEHGDNDW